MSTERICGTGGWDGPLPGDPDNNIGIQAVGAVSGITVTWGYPGTNPHAVAHGKLYRSTSANDYGNVIAIVNGSMFFDSLEPDDLTEYYYWIELVSVNGTVADKVGPAFASAISYSDSLYDYLRDRIDEGVLATSLRQKIDRISLNSLGITNEILERAKTEDALGAAYNIVEAHSGDTRALLEEEVLARTTANEAFVAEVNTLSASKAEIYYQGTAPIGDSLNPLKVGAFWFNTFDGDKSYRWNGNEWKPVNTATIDQTNAAVQENNRSMIGYCAVNGSPSQHLTAEECSAAGGSWVAAAPFAQALKTVQVTDSQGYTASVQQRMEAYETAIGDLGSLYTVQVDNGVVGGFGVYNDGSTVQAGFNVNTFWVGKPGDDHTTGKYPFVIEGDEISFRGKVDFSSVENGPPSDATRNVFKGEWGGSGEYREGDMVTYKGNGWVALITHSISSNKSPPEDAGNTSRYWAVFSVKATDGIPGTPGNDGKTLFTWIKYADDSLGNGLSNYPSGKEYIGIANNKENSIESLSKSDYVWSKIKGEKGDKGEQGIRGEEGPRGYEGKKGVDGKDRYTWVAYSSSANGYNPTSTPNSETNYIGIAVNKLEQRPSSLNRFEFEWSKYRGDNGVPGKEGKDGVTTYTWIRYADNSTGSVGFSDLGEGKEYIGFAYNKVEPTESENYRDYKWSKLKGDQGETSYTWLAYSANSNGYNLKSFPDETSEYIGIATNKTTPSPVTLNRLDFVWSKYRGDKGVKGKDGTDKFTWIKYANSSDGSIGFSDSPVNKEYIGIAYNKETQEESVIPGDYVWSKLKGDPGEDGKEKYTWIAYSNFANGSAMYWEPNESTKYIGIAVNKPTATPSENKDDYDWASFKGEKGTDGKDGKDGLNGKDGILDPYFSLSAKEGLGVYWTNGGSKVFIGNNGTLGNYLGFTSNVYNGFDYVDALDGKGNTLEIPCSARQQISLALHARITAKYNGSLGHWTRLGVVFRNKSGNFISEGFFYIDLAKDGLWTLINAAKNIIVPDGATYFTVRVGARNCKAEFYYVGVHTDRASTLAVDWVRPGTTTIDGNKIHTGDAYVDTLEIKGNAVTVAGYGYAAEELALPDSTHLYTVCEIWDYDTEGADTFFVGSFGFDASDISWSGNSYAHANVYVYVQLERSGHVIRDFGLAARATQRSDREGNVSSDGIGLVSVSLDHDGTITVSCPIPNISGLQDYKLNVRIAASENRIVRNRYAYIMGRKR